MMVTWARDAGIEMGRNEQFIKEGKSIGCTDWLLGVDEKEDVVANSCILGLKNIVGN